MIAAAALLSILAVVAIVTIAVSLRSVVEDEKRTESQLHDLHTPTITYAVPNGVDPVVFAVALKRAGYLSIVTEVGSSQGLLVRCETGERERLRHVLDDVVSTHDTPARTLYHAVFEDER